MSRADWTEEHTRYLLAHYERQRLADIARELGMPVERTRARFRALVREGAADVTRRAYQPPWSAAELRWARERIGTPGWTYSLIAEKLGRSVDAVKLKFKRVGLRAPVRRRIAATLSLRDVMDALGLGGNHDRARAWIERGLLRATRAPEDDRPAHRRWVIYRGDLIEFLWAHPEAYEAHRIPAEWRGGRNPFREYARPQAATAGYVMLKQAARVLGVVPETLRRWVREGRIAAVHLAGPGIHPQEWWVTRAELEAALRRRVRMKNGWWTLPQKGATR